MQTLQDLFDNLAYGEFANLALGNSPLGSITEDKYPKVVAAINMGLTELHKRFVLKKKKVLLTQQTGVLVYYLRSDYLGDYLEDFEQGEIESLDDDIIRVLQIVDADGTDVPLNNPRYLDTGVFTDGHDILSMVPATPLKTLTVIYQAKYPRIKVTETFDPERVKLYFPEFITEPLLAYVAARVFKGKTSKAAEGEHNISATFHYQFEAACKKIMELGLAEEPPEVNSRFVNKGWV
jgi:hypothetical protein